MIGKIVVGLLAVVCFSCVLTDALLSDCDFYKPKASFANITGFAYVIEDSARDPSCLSLTIDPSTPSISSLLGVKDYSATYTFDLDGSLVYDRFTLQENPLRAGQAESTHQILGEFEVTIFLRNLPADSDIVTELKKQLPRDLQNIPPNVIPHSDTCGYPPH